MPGRSDDPGEAGLPAGLDLSQAAPREEDVVALQEELAKQLEGPVSPAPREAVARSEPEEILSLDELIDAATAKAGDAEPEGHGPLLLQGLRRDGSGQGLSRENGYCRLARGDC